MKNHRTLSIAGAHFVITGPGNISLEGILPHYQDFYQEFQKETGCVEIDVQLKITEMPEVGHLPLLFDTDQNWWLRYRQNEYFIGFRGMRPGQLRCLAQFDPRKTTHFTIHCGPELMIRNGNLISVTNPVSYPLDQLLLMYMLAGRQGAVIHAAGMDFDGCGVIFPGRSGAGKSTLSRQFNGCNNPRRLSDDRMVIRKINNKFLAFGTPWPGDEKVAVNQQAPLTAICFIHHASANHIKKLNPQAALEKLLPVTSIPWYDREFMPPILMFLEDIVNHIPAFDLHIKPTKEVVPFLEEFVLNLNN